jgi:GntR family transcriptional regulator/MocR family aminotransferase
MRAALRRAADTDLAYGDPFGSRELRTRLAPFLARTRGTVVDTETLSIHAGSTQALGTIARTLLEHGAKTLAVEDPSHRWRTATLEASGLELVPVAADSDGLCVEALPDVDAVIVSPAHSFPLGAALSPVRRRALVEWAVSGDRMIVEHDYDGHFRYDRAPTAALQALAPSNVAYIGTVSPLLAPTIRIGWTIAPSRFSETIGGVTMRTTFAQPRLDQLALAEFIARGYLDRGLRRARAAYKRRRDLVARTLPTTGAAAGLFVHVPLPQATDEDRVLREARAAGIALDGVRANAIGFVDPGVVVGFAASPEPTLERALAALSPLIRGA